MRNAKGFYILAGCIGVFVGVALTRTLLLDAIEKLAFEMFFSNGGPFELGRVLTSTTFWKCVVGAVAGGTAAVFGARMMIAAKVTPPPESGGRRS